MMRRTLELIGCYRIVGLLVPKAQRRSNECLPLISFVIGHHTSFGMGDSKLFLWFPRRVSQPTYRLTNRAPGWEREIGSKLLDA